MGVFLVAFLLATIVCHVYSETDPNNNSLNDNSSATTQIQWKEFWVFRLLLNMIGYGTIIVPGYLVIRYLQGSDFLKQTGKYMGVNNSVLNTYELVSNLEISLDWIVQL